MEIYIVQPGDDINSISKKFRVPADRLILDNGIDASINLVPGQTIVVIYPVQTHIAQEGETLYSIANDYGVSFLQLLRNNPSLSGKDLIYPGESLVISYNTEGKVTTNGYAYPYLNRDTLIKTLPYLTYLSVFNYRLLGEGEIVAYYDDAEIIQTAIDYGTVPLMMISSLSSQGAPNIQAGYDILLNEEHKECFIDNVVNVLHSTSFQGINLMFSVINSSNLKLYIDLLANISNRLKNEGYRLLITINPNIVYNDNGISFEQIDYSSLCQLVDGITFLQYFWGTNTGEPSPVSSIPLMKYFLDTVVKQAPPEKLSIGKPLIGYDWALPYVSGYTTAYSLTLNSAITMAQDIGTIIQFDEISQTPYYLYWNSCCGIPVEHIVWFINARSINALDNLVAEYHLAGSGIWNIMVYYQQMWTIINSQYEIIKLVPGTSSLLTK